MNIQKTCTLFSLMFLMLFACDSVRESELYYQEMMEIHHQDMVVWGEIPGLKKSIKTELENLEKSRLGQEIDSLRVQTLQKSLEQLEAANEEMYEWMNKFKAPAKDATEEEAMKHLKAEREKMETMGQHVSDAVIGAKDLLKKLSE